MSRPPFTLDDLIVQLQRLADDPETPDPLLPKEEDRTEQISSLARRWRMRRDDLYEELRAIRRSRLQVSRDVVIGDLERDPLVRTYALAAIDVANSCLVETMEPPQRDLLAGMAATATMVYDAWTPTIQAEGDDYMAVKRRLSNTSHVSWHDAYPFAPVIITNARPSRRVRTPLLQFIIWWRLRVTVPGWEKQWENLRTVECLHEWTEFVYADRVRQRTWDHWMFGDTWIPSTFLSDVRRNRYPHDELAATYKDLFGTIRTLQRYRRMLRFGLGRWHAAKADRLLAGLMAIPYHGRLIAPARPATP